MERLIRYGSVSEIPFYNCSWKSSEEWNEMGLKRPIIGWFLVVFGGTVEDVWWLSAFVNPLGMSFIVIIHYLFITTSNGLIPTFMCATQDEKIQTGALPRKKVALSQKILYLPILYIIFKTKLIKYACYKLIVFLALTDMSATVCSSIISGVLYIQGAVFCTYPTFAYIAGGFAINTWCMACAINIALFANRVCSIAFHEYIDVIEGKMTWISMVVAFVYGMYILFFTPVICFNSVALAWIPEPLSEKETSEEAEAMYDNVWQSANNYLFVVIMSFLYITYCVLVKKLAHGQKSKKSRAIFIQCAVICFFNTVTALVYNALSLMTPALWIVLLGQLCWSINHGCPAIIYLTMNDTIRHSFLNLFGGKRVTKVDTTNSAQHVAVSHVI